MLNDIMHSGIKTDFGMVQSITKTDRISGHIFISVLAYHTT